MFDWLREHMIPCPFKVITGHDCPGCGMQRAIIELLDGNIWLSIQFYPALITLVIMFVTLALHLKFHWKHGALVLKIMFIFNAIIIAVFYILKTFNIFTL